MSHLPAFAAFFPAERRVNSGGFAAAANAMGADDTSYCRHCPAGQRRGASGLNSQYPFAQNRLTAKVLALLAYIVPVTMAMKRGCTGRICTAAFVVAVLVFLYIVGVGVSHNPAFRAEDGARPGGALRNVIPARISAGFS